MTRAHVAKDTRCRNPHCEERERLGAAHRAHMAARAPPSARPPQPLGDRSSKRDRICAPKTSRRSKRTAPKADGTANAAQRGLGAKRSRVVKRGLGRRARRASVAGHGRGRRHNIYSMLLWHNAGTGSGRGQGLGLGARPDARYGAAQCVWCVCVFVERKVGALKDGNAQTRTGGRMRRSKECDGELTRTAAPP